MTRRAPVSVRVCPDGPLLVRGAEEVEGPDGQLHPVTHPFVALCRCEKSSSPPWCDGTHKVVRPRNGQAPRNGE